MVRVPELSEIKKIREELGLSQRKLAKFCEIQPSYLNMLENNPHSKPGYDVLVRIFKKLEEESQKGLDNLTTAGKICNKQLITANKNDFVEDIIKLMHSKDISQIPVMDSKGCIGLVTESSFVKYLKENGKEKLVTARVKDALETPPPTVDVNEKVTNNLLVLLNDSRCLLVTDQGRMCGIITKMDALRSLMKK
jgi:predicted transcriptional regulator